MPNPFDQFDQPTAQAAPQQAPMQQASPPSGNPFDQFDQAAQQPAAQAPQMPTDDMSQRVQRKLTEKVAEAAKQDPTILDRAKRQLGLAGRYAIEGIGDVAQIVSEPVRQGLNVIPGVDIQYAPPETLPGMAGLPEPETKAEKIVGTASRTLMSAAPFVRAGQMAAQAPGAVRSAVGEMVSTQPGVQAVSAGSAGAAGETARQEGIGPTGQFFASMAGGLSPALASSLGNKARGIGRMLSRGKVSNELTDELLKRNNIDVKGMEVSARNALRNDVRKAVKVGDTVDQAALRRLADYRQVGATPTRGTVTLDPADVTMEKNLAKIGVNTGDDALQRLAQIQNENDQILTQSLNRLGAEGADDTTRAATRIMKTLVDGDKVLKEGVNKAYRAVRDSSGRYAKLNTRAFSQRANDLLDEQMLGSALPKSTKNLLNDISDGSIPLDMNTMVQIDKRLSGQARDAFRAGNSEAALAVKQIRDALQETPLDSQAGEQARNLYNQARQLARQRFSVIEKTPALKAALDDAAPDDFVRKYIISGSKANERDVAGLANLLSEEPQAMNQARTQILAHLKNKALSGAPDELGKFSPANFRRELSKIGDKKLGMFFNDQELAEINAIKRVAGYEKFRPTGAAVNESNTAATLIGKGLDAIAGGASRVPFGGSAVSEPLRNIMRGREAANAENVVRALIQRGEQAPAGASAIMPAIYGAGLTSGATQE